MAIVLFSHQNQRSVFNEVDVVLQTSVFCSWRNKKRLRPLIQKIFNQFLFTEIKALRCTTILVTSQRCQGDINKGVYQYAVRTLLPGMQSYWFGSWHPLVKLSNSLAFYFPNLVFFLFRNKSVLEYNRGIIFNDGKDSNSLIMLEQGV